MKIGARSVVFWCLISLLFFLVPSLRAGWIRNGGPIAVAPWFQEYPAITPDGAGGAFITWTDARTADFNIYAQRVNANGDTLWQANGIALCDTADTKTQSYIIPDGSGGAIITWMDRRTFLVRDWDIYAQRIDADGNRLWPSNGLAVCDTLDKQWYARIATDGSGGAIIAWEDWRGDKGGIYAQRIDGSGTALWERNGIGICTNANYPGNHEIITDGAGGAIIAWEDTRFIMSNIYAQRVDANGDTLWPANGVPICLADLEQRAPELISDGAGGAIITWADQRMIGSYIYAQRVDANGDTLWPADGIIVSMLSNSQNQPRITTDGSGGAIIAWAEGFSGDDDIYAQRVDGSGNLLWTANGIGVCTAADRQAYVRIKSDGSGGAIIAWEDARNGHSDIYAQRLDANGNALWTINGIAVCDTFRDQEHVDFITTGSGETFFTWDDTRNESDTDVYASLADANGQIVPTLLQSYSAKNNNGTIVVNWILSTVVSSESFTVYRKNITGLNSWNILPVEIENRENSYSFTDATCLPGLRYRYRVEVIEETGRRMLFETDPMSVPEKTLVLYQNYPNPFNPSTTLKFFLPEKSIVTLSVFDASGSLISKLLDNKTKPIGFHTVEWDGKGKNGRKVTSGVYFYRLKAGRLTKTKKMIILH